jgi:hypothetical protein
LDAREVNVGNTRDLFILHRSVNRFAHAYIKLCMPHQRNLIVEPQRATEKTIIREPLISRLKSALLYHFPNYDWLAVRESLNQVLRENRVNRGRMSV